MKESRKNVNVNVNVKLIFCVIIEEIPAFILNVLVQKIENWTNYDTHRSVITLRAQ